MRKWFSGRPRYNETHPTFLFKFLSILLEENNYSLTLLLLNCTSLFDEGFLLYLF